MSASFFSGGLGTWAMKIGGLRPARRLPFCPSGNKKEAKNSFLLRRASRSPAFMLSIVFEDID
jgi:hypothetical protein